MKRRSITAGISVSKKLKSHAQISKSRFARAKYRTRVFFLTEVPDLEMKTDVILLCCNISMLIDIYEWS